MRKIFLEIFGILAISVLTTIATIFGCGNIKGPLEKSGLRAPKAEVEPTTVVISPYWMYNPEDYRLTIADTPLIIIGTVKSASPLKFEWELLPNEDRPPIKSINIYQESVVKVEEVLKADKGITPPKRLVVRSFGGRVGKYTLTVAGCEHAPFEKGEKVLLFLNPVRNANHWIISAARYGRFRITEDGRLIRPGWVGTDGEPFPEKEFDLSQFKALIKEVSELQK